MQSWSNNGQNGADETQHQWHNNYAFSGQNGQFDPHTAWQQSVAEQSAYPPQINSQDASTSNFFDSDQGHSFLSGTLHGSQQDQAAYHSGHDSLSMNQQFTQQSQDVMDTDFGGIHPDIYAQHGKMNMDNAIAGIGQLSNHPHSSNFAYSMPPPNESSYESPIQQYSQPHVIPQPTRQQSHTPVQQFEGIPQTFAQGHGFSRPPQPSPVQNQQQYSQAGFSPPVNGQTPQPRPTDQLNFQQPHQQGRQQTPHQQHQQQQPLQALQPHAQPQFAPKQSVAYSQTSQSLPGQSFQHHVQQQQPHFAGNAPSPSAANNQYLIPQPIINQDAGIHQSVANEPPAKKRKRAIKSAPDTPTPEPAAIYADSPADSSAVKKVDEIDGLPAPTPSPEEAQLIAQFNKRPKVAQAKYPAIKGLPYLIYDGTTMLPAPKSYDKLAPLVAQPARSGRQMVPELGYNLPCEVQGRFTSQYRPSPDKGGLDERRMESEALLDEFDRAMKGLGKRRPKYTEYPHAFKEQLKSDEALKNKAEKKAKKELEEERGGKPIRAATRPTDPAEAAAWDAIGMVHFEQSVARTNALIASRVQQAGEYLIKLRGEMNRAKQELDQAVKDKKPETAIARERQEFEQKKQILYRALDATIEHADDAVLDNLGGHQKLVLSLVNALIMCIKAGDFSGKLPKIVLEMFTHFPMTKKIAETTNFETVRKRFADKGDTEVKELASEIAAKIRKLKANDSEKSTGYTGTSASSRAKTKPGMESSAKRGRDDETDTRTVKKIAIESSGNALSRKLAQPKIQLQSASKTSAAKATASSILPGKPRPVVKPIPKPEVKTDVKAASDDKAKAELKPPRPETKPTASRNGTTAIPATSSSNAASSALSGIASLLDSINAPKAESPAAPKESIGPETSESPEERAKRLRKEARRKLRVSWKPESELVQVKIFHKEDAEDEGREQNMIRDAADDRSEGMVLKQRANEEEEEEDDDVPYQPWMGPVETDLSRLPTDVRNKNFVTRGGNVTFTTDEQQRIADREQRELMAIYTDPDDIPPSPKSPPPETAEASQQKTQYLPDDIKFQEIQLRWRDEQHVGTDRALFSALQRIDGKNNPGNRIDSILGSLQGGPSAPRSSHQHASGSHHNTTLANDTLPIVAGRAVLEQVIVLLQSDKARNWRDTTPTKSDVWRAFHYSDVPTRLCGGAVEGVAKSLAGLPFPANSPPEWILHDHEKVREWQMGYNKEITARQKKQDGERVRTGAEANALQTTASGALSGQAPANPQDWAAYYAQQQTYAPYMALLQQMTGGQQAAQPAANNAPAQQQPHLADNQLQSILAAINQPTPASAPAAASNAAPYLNPNDPSYQQYLLLSQMTQGQQAPPPPPPPPAGEREWDREREFNRDRDQDRGWDRDRDDHHGSRGDRDGKDARKKRGTLPPHKPANKALIGTKPCTFWQQGKCARGDKCTFRHD
ncbi:transcription factor [Fusarium heterosporum]|uniref:Transcription factor n=1 Tax=Fusarium heterosporum TaxID=42747 RepID=A0A8H5WL74_FUSHE|nr:transcription factor [Fusarium heterosporum]